MNIETMVEREKIWDISRIADRETSRMELTDLIRFKGNWYCSFREGEIHNNHPSGRARIIRSQDGEHWESAALFEWESADVREVRLSITQEGWLMGNTSLYFVSAQPRFRENTLDHLDSYTPGEATNPQDRAGGYYQLEKPGTPGTDCEEQVARQSVTWLSQDGTNWSSAYAPASGVNFWRWDVTWHNGMGYSAGHRAGNADGNGTLFRTRDGKDWRVLTADCYPDQKGNEASIAFGQDGTAYGLLRGAGRRQIKQPAAVCETYPLFGMSKSPCYREWEWQELNVDLGNGAGLLSAEEALLADLGGPKLIRLSDGRFVAAGRVLFPGDSDGHVSLFFLDPASATLQKFADVDGTSYAGIAEHEGQIWVSCADTHASAIYLAKVNIPFN